MEALRYYVCLNTDWQNNEEFFNIAMRTENLVTTNSLHQEHYRLR